MPLSRAASNQQTDTGKEMCRKYNNKTNLQSVSNLGQSLPWLQTETVHKYDITLSEAAVQCSIDETSDHFLLIWRFWLN